MSGKLYICPTPIGNLEDMTYRTIRILNEVDLIAAEDTRHSLKLLNHLEISKPLISYHRHNEEEKQNGLIEKLKEVFDFINFLYPEKFGEFKNIHSHKENTVNILLKIFKTVADAMGIVFVVDNFTDLDRMSLEFINTLISTPDILSNSTFVLTFSEPKSAIACLPHKDLEDSAYDNITIAPLTREQLVPILDKYKNLELSIEQKNLIHKYSKGNPADFEQIINLVADKQRNGLPFALPQNMKDVIYERLGLLKTENEKAYKVLIAVAILGCKSNPIILNMFDDIDLDDLEQILNKLTKLNYLVSVTNVTYEFKSLALWEMILDEIKKDIANSLYSQVSNNFGI